MRRWLRALLAALALLVLAPAAAGAHAVLLTSDPPAGTVVDAQPSEVVLRFSEAVETTGGELAVAASDGSRVERGEVELREGRHVVAVGLEDGLAEGSYSVAWRVTSADAHVITGSFVFSVGRPGPTYAGPLIADASWTADLVAGIGRALQFAGTLAAIGMPVFLLAVWWPLLGSARSRLGDALDPAAAAFRTDATTVALAATIALVGGALIAIPAQAWQTGGSISGVLDTRFGEVGLVRLVLAPIASALLVLAVARPTTIRAVAALAVALPLAALPGAAGHASTADTAWLALTIDAVHVAAAGVWAGGLLLLAVAAGAALRQLDAEARRPFLRGAVRRFTRVAASAVAVIAVSGVVAGLRELDGIANLVDTRYGQVLGLKVLVVLTALAVALASRRGGPTFVRDVRGEVTLLAVAIALTAGLTGLAPGEVANAAAPRPFSLQRPVGPHILTFEIAPARAGVPNDVHIVISNPVGQPALDVRSARLVVALPSAGIADLEVPLKLLTAAHWQGSATFPQPGDWQARLEVRRGTFDREDIEATVPVAR